MSQKYFCTKCKGYHYHGNIYKTHWKYRSEVTKPKINKEEENAIEFISGLIMSGGDVYKYQRNVRITRNGIRYLQQTVKKPIKLYRGISLIRRRFNPKQREIVNKLMEGDKLPPFLYKSSFFDNPYSSYTKKKSIANYYAREGDVSIVVEKIIYPKNILVDLSNLHEIAPNSEFVKKNQDYFREDKEVIVIEPISNLVIIKKRGYFK